MNSQQSSSSVTNISSLGEELLIEIFSRLGPESKHAVGCKLVSKLWLSILRTSCFTRRWRQINRTEEHELPSILLTQYIHGPVFANRSKNYRQVFDNFASNVPNLKGLSSFQSFGFLAIENVYILATYKDLVRCCPSKNDHSAYYLCNPFTKRWTALPPPPPIDGIRQFARVGLMVYDDDDDDDCSFNFKILRIIPYPEDEVWKVEVFSSQDISAGWRVIDNADGWRDVYLFCCDFSRCVPYNGMLVWLVQSWEEEPIATAKLIGFKLNNPDGVDSSVLPTPPGFEADSTTAMIGLFRGKLRLAQWVGDVDLQGNHLEHPFRVLKIWQLGSEWELLHEMDLLELEGSPGYLIARSCLLDELWRLATSILAFDPRDGDSLYLLFDSTGPREREVEDSSFIFMCNVKQRTLKLVRRLLYPCDSLRLLVPSWPTSVPLLPPSV